MKKSHHNIDSSNIEELRKFFAEHEDYYPYEISAKYEIPISTIRRWKRKVSEDRFESRHTKQFLPNKNVEEVELINDQDIWDNKSWFEEMYCYKKLGADTIAKMIGRSKPVVYKRLKRYGIERREHRDSTKSKNKFYDKDWLIDNYFKKGKSLRELAKTASVSPYTISNWLISFGMLPRSNSEALVKTATAKRIEKWNRRTEN